MEQDPRSFYQIKEKQQRKSFQNKKLKGEKDVYRIRVGDFRVLYRIIPEDEAILIFRVDKRSRVYGR